MNFQAKWIRPAVSMGDICPVFKKEWTSDKEVVKAELLMTSLGVYEAHLNGKRISEYVLAPGWTAYEQRLQYQVYDITDMITDENELLVTLGKGWFSSPMPGWVDNPDKLKRKKQKTGLFSEIHLTYSDDTKQIIPTDNSWKCTESNISFSEIYDGENVDARVEFKDWKFVSEFNWSTDILIPQEGEEIVEKERLSVKEVIITPIGETVLDFGQNITGYVEFNVNAKSGDKIHLLHGEVLDQFGNFYNENYRSAKAQINYICCDGQQSFKPRLTFFGFRYIKLAEFPTAKEPEQFTAIAVYSNMKRTGRIKTSNALLNQLFSNIIWGQVGNFLDVPTDCPQRDERLGWTGDAQVFVKAASYNFDVEKFFTKWLNDLQAEQYPDGAVPDIIPDYFKSGLATQDQKKGVASAAWGDAATICPWQIYLTYGNEEILRNQFVSMKKWIDFITNITEEDYLWIGSEHYGDWCGLDAPVGSYKGSTREDFIASAYYAYSTSLVIKAGKVIGQDVTEYEFLYNNIVTKFRSYFKEYQTQTEYVLAIHFELAENLPKAANELVEKIKKDGTKLQTGFVGTPYIMHALSKYGHIDIAYELLLRETYPSWLYPVTKDATTIWEHWDGIMENGDFWSADMNSFNHYAYGAVADWIYEEAAGIKPMEKYPGFEKVVIEPKANQQLEFLEASIHTRHGQIRSDWRYEAGSIRYEIDTPIPALITIDGKTKEVSSGQYVFWSKR